MDDFVQQGVAAFHAGERHLARQLLAKAVETCPDDVLAWRWLADVVDSPIERRVCLERLLTLQDDPCLSDELARLGPPPRPVPSPTQIISAAQRIGSMHPEQRTARSSWHSPHSF